MSGPQVLYRYQESYYSENTVMLVLSTFRVLRTTPCGAWVENYGRERFVLLTARKKFACATQEEALASFRARKRRQISILRARLAAARAALRLEPNGARQDIFGDSEEG